MLLRETINSTFVSKLKKELASIGIVELNIQCMLLGGSALYLENANDIDVKVIVRKYNPKAETARNFSINGKKVDCNFYTFKDWGNVCNYKKAYFIVESPDMVCLCGDDSEFCRHDVTKEPTKAKHVLEVYDKSLFNWSKEGSKGYPKMDGKRLWNFLLFYYKMKNGSNAIDEVQLAEIAKAHDGKKKADDCRPLFEELKQLIG